VVPASSRKDVPEGRDAEAWRPKLSCRDLGFADFAALYTVLERRQTMIVNITQPEALDAFSLNLAKRLVPNNPRPVGAALEDAYPGLRALLTPPFPPVQDAKQKFRELLDARVLKLGPNVQGQNLWNQLIIPLDQVLPALVPVPPGKLGTCTY